MPPHGVFNAVLKFMKKWYFYPSILTLNLYGLVYSQEKSRNAFFSKNIPDDELKEYSEKLCSESFLAFMKMLFPRIKVNNHLKIPMLVIGGKNDKLFSHKDHEQTARKYKAELIMADNISHDMMLDLNHDKVSELMINWLHKN